MSGPEPTARPAVGLLLAFAFCLGGLGGPARAEPAGRVMEGTDAAVIELPAGLEIEAYRGAGYRLEPEGRRVRVEVELSPLATRTPFGLPPSTPRGDVDRLARRLTADAGDRYEAVSRILRWIATHVRYRLDRSLPQDPASVLARGDAYCTGAARLAVALLAAVAIPAREVPGYVVGEDGGFHRWIEVWYPDRGWVSSDPRRSHHFVPASYVRLAGERIRSAGDPGAARLLVRHRRLVAVDVEPSLPAGVAVRRNGVGRRAAALVVDAGTGASRATLEGPGKRYTLELREGRGEFVDLQPGRYRLSVELPGASLVRHLSIEGRDRRALHLAPAGGGAAAGGPAVEDRAATAETATARRGTG